MGHYPKAGRPFILVALILSSALTVGAGQGHGQRNPRMGGKGGAPQRNAQQRNAQQQGQRKAGAQDGRTASGQPKPATGQDQERKRAAVDQPKPAAQNQPPANRPRPVLDRQELARQQIFRQIGVNQEQQERMVNIRNRYDDQLAASGRQLRLAQRGLDEAMMSPQYNPAEVNRRIEALAQAHAERVRVMQRVKAEIRQVLTPEQVMKFNQVQREMQQKQQELKRIEMLQQTSPEKNPSGDQNQSSQAPSFDMVDVFIASGR